jgi:uncharacterized protein
VRVFPAPGGFFVRLDRGEDLLGKLTDFFVDERVGSAALSGIGAIEQTTLGYFDLARREYTRIDYPGSMELVSLAGNFAWAGDEPIIHAHAVISGPDGVAHGGHLFAARISATGEVMVWTSSERRQRALDAATGLRLISDP